MAILERFTQTLQPECLDYFIVFGQEHMDYLLNEMVSHDNEERPHQSKDNSPLMLARPANSLPMKAMRKQGESPPDIIPVSYGDAAIARVDN